jgi:hypothetical protein
MRERFLETRYPFPIYLFDPDAPAAHTKQLPIPYRKLPCDPKPPAENKAGTEPLAPSPPAAPKVEKKEEPAPTPPPFVSPKQEQEPEPWPRPPKDGATSGWTRMVLPLVCYSASRVKVLPTRTVLPMKGRSQTGGARTVVAAAGDGTKEGEKNTAEDPFERVQGEGRSGLCGERSIAAPAPGMKKPEPPPPGGKDYAASKAIEQARHAALDAERVGVELGGKFGKAIGDAQEALKTLNRLAAGALPRILKSNPKFVDELQSGLAQKLNAIPELPAYADPKLAEIVRKGFERGLGYGLADAKLKATAVYLAAEVALTLSGSAAILAQRAGTTALRAALARLKGMPVFVPGAIEGGGAFFRLPKPQIAQVARGVTTAQQVAGKISGSLKCFGRCADFANALQKGLQKAGVSGTRIEIQVGKGITPYSNKFGALAERGRSHTAIRVGDTVFDNFRPGGVPYSEFIADLGGLDFFGTPFVKVIEAAF